MLCCDTLLLACHSILGDSGAIGQQFADNRLRATVYAVSCSAQPSAQLASHPIPLIVPQITPSDVLQLRDSIDLVHATGLLRSLYDLICTGSYNRLGIMEGMLMSDISEICCSDVVGALLHCWDVCLCIAVLPACPAHSPVMTMVSCAAAILRSVALVVNPHLLGAYRQRSSAAASGARAPAIAAACRGASVFCAAAAAAGGRGLVARMQRALHPGSRFMTSWQSIRDVQVRKRASQALLAHCGTSRYNAFGLRLMSELFERVFLN